MTDIDVLDMDGQPTKGTANAQIALAHAYGDGLEVSCENTVRAVEHLMYFDNSPINRSIDNYAFFLKISLIASGILLFLTVVPTLISAMNVKTSGYSEFLRKAFPVIASSSLLMLSLLAYPFVRHITSNIGAFVYLTGAAESALMRLPYVLTDVKKYRSERFRLKNEK